MRQDLLSDVLSIINNAERAGKRNCVAPRSKLALNILTVMKEEKYIANFTDSGESIDIELAGKVNMVRAIKPRFPVQKSEYEKFERRYLPSHNIGILIVSTPKGIMTQKQAVSLGLGGKLLAYVY
ncbi:MAG: 30S ribosomal protein S8 [Candidatus Aenigmatarchaeota archaeon]